MRGLVIKVIALGVVMSGMASVWMPDAEAVLIKPPGTAVLYGDSIMYESAPYVATQFARKKGWRFSIRAFPGIAPCDLVPQLAADLVTLQPKVVTLETMGNSFVSCMLDANGERLPYGSVAYYDRYRADFNTFFGLATAAGAKVVFITPLPQPYPVNMTVTDRLNAIAREEAAKFSGVSISVAARNAVGVGRKFTPTKRCLLTETATMGCDPSTRKITVRAPDGVHLCPTGYPTPESFLAFCSVYSSGAFRFARAVVSATVSPPKPVTP